MSIYQDSPFDVIQANIISELSKTFGHLRLDELVDITDAVETRARDFVAEEISAWCSRRPGFEADGRHATRFWNDATPYEVIVQADPHSPSDLHVVVLAREQGSQPRRKPAAENTSLAEAGKYRRVRAYVAPELGSETETLIGIARVVLMTFYRWLEEELVAAVATEENAIAIDLYSTLRVALPDPAVHRHIWFSIYDGLTGRYLVDPTGMRMAITHTKGTGLPLDDSPAQMLSEFVTDVIDYAITNSKVAIEKGECTEFDLKRSTYARTKPVLARAQRALADSDVAAIYPLKKDGKFLLAAVFPARPVARKLLIVHTLAAHRNHLVERFECHRGVFRKLRTTLRHWRGGFPAGTVGEVVGGMVRGYFGDS
jgi:hypothetical protein